MHCECAGTAPRFPGRQILIFSVKITWRPAWHRVGKVNTHFTRQDVQSCDTVRYRALFFNLDYSVTQNCLMALEYLNLQTKVHLWQFFAPLAWWPPGDCPVTICDTWQEYSPTHTQWRSQEFEPEQANESISMFLPQNIQFLINLDTIGAYIACFCHSLVTDANER